MADIQRPNYFTSQFLVEKDFNEEQAYHREMRWQHNRALHTWGVVEGLVVRKITGNKEIAVSTGMAVNSKGREIVILPGSSLLDNNISLEGFPADITIKVTIIYRELVVEETAYQVGSETKYTRIKELPKFVIYVGDRGQNLQGLNKENVEVIEDSAPTDGTVILLAEVELDNNGNVRKIKDARQLAGVKVASNIDYSLTITNADFAVSGGNFRLGTSSVKEISKDVNLAGNDEVISTTKAVKTHVDNQISQVNNNLDTKAALNGSADQDFTTKNLSVRGALSSGDSSRALQVGGPLSVTGAIAASEINASGTIQANKFEGDGSALTGIDYGTTVIEPAGGLDKSLITLNANNEWSPFIDLSRTFELSKPGIVIIYYKISMTLAGHLVTRLKVDSVEKSRTISGDQNFVADCDLVVVKLSEGVHTAEVEYRTAYVPGAVDNNGINNPEGQGKSFDFHNRMLQVISLGCSVIAHEIHLLLLI